MKTLTLRSQIYLLKDLLGKWVFKGLLTITFITVCFLASGQNGKMPGKPKPAKTGLKSRQQIVLPDSVCRILHCYDADKSEVWIDKTKLQEQDSLNIIALNKIQAKKDSIEEAKKPKIDSQKETNEMIDYVEEMPSFPQGDVIEYIRKHIIYPPVALEKKIQGRVIVQFWVDLDGSVIDVKIARGIHPELDKEAVRVVQSMPKWKPARQRNQPVRVKYTLPVQFTLPINSGISYSVIANQKFRKTDSANIAELDRIQAKKDSIEEAKKPRKPEQFWEGFICAMDEAPQFFGDVVEYIRQHIIYPPQAVEKKIEGRVITQFWINADGTVGDIKVIRGVSPELDAEAIRVIQDMPKWKPARQRNQPVRVRYTLPVQFTLPKQHSN